MGNKINIGIFYLDFMGIYLEMKDFEKVLINVDKVLVIVEEIKFGWIKFWVLGYLLMIYVVKGDVEKVLVFNIEYWDLMDSL